MTQLKKRLVQLEVLRYDPEKNTEPYFQKYEVEILQYLAAYAETK